MKHLLTLLFLLALLPAAPAQVWMVGARGGLNVSSIAGEQSDKFSIKPGFHAGFFSEYRLGLRGGVFLDILYSQKGANYDTERNQGLRDARLRLDYLDVPLALIYYPVEQFGFYAGPQVSILVFSKLKTGSTEDRYDDIAAAADYGLVGGFRLRPTRRLAIDLRYNYNFTDMSEYDIGLSNGESVKDLNHVASLSLGYALYVRER